MGARIQRALPADFPAVTREWLVLGGDAVQIHLDAARGLPHRAFTTVLCEAIGFSDAETLAVGDAMDLIQVAIEIADDVADWEDDVARQRAHVPIIGSIPADARPAVPIVATLAATNCLTRGFAGSERMLARSVARLTGVLGAMVWGQGVADAGQHMALTSGEQACMLGLPLWLSAETAEAQQQQFDAWARRFGLTWELQFRVREKRIPRSELESAKEACRACWPDFSPFLAGETLEIRQLLPRGLC